MVLAWIVRGEMTRRLRGQYERRIEAQVTVIEQDLARRSEAIGRVLRRLQWAIEDDNDFRVAVQGSNDRAYMLDYAGEALEITGLSMLQIQDGAGRIVSSGHFRNEYDRLEPELPAGLAALDRAALVKARTPEGEFIALARVDSVSLAGQKLALVGGYSIDHTTLSQLQRGTEVIISLFYPEGVIAAAQDSTVSATGPALVRKVPVSFITQSIEDEAYIQIVYPLSELTALQQNIDDWFRWIGLVTGLLAAGVAIWLSARISRPIADLAEKTALVDLDRLDIDFRTRRNDEIGALSRLMGSMTHRLRKSAATIKETERKAAIGDLARQVNHDIKNGLAPIRNVLRHLLQLASDKPEELPGVLLERQATLDSGMSYLQDLAANYARLTPHADRQPCDLNAIVSDAANDLRARGQGKIQTRLNDIPAINADPISLRRIVENLAGNALESLEDGRGTVTLTTEIIEDGGIVRLIVADDGVGMTSDQIDSAFTDFYTTKEHGTGLGLSIVRRLVMDLGGSIRVESEPGKGSRFIVEIDRVGGRESDVRSHVE